MKMHIYKFFQTIHCYLLAGSMLCSGAAYAQLASWALGSNANVTAGTGITAAMNLGSGVTDAGYATHYGASGCTGRVIRNWTSSTTSISAAMSGAKYVEFTITPTGQNLLVSSFQFSMSAGFTTNGTGAGSMAVRFSKDNFATNTWLKHPSACSSELIYSANSSNNGSCANYTFNSSSSGSCTANPWPISVTAGQTLSFRIYIGTTQSATMWRTALRSVTINGVTSLPVTLTNFAASCAEESAVDLLWSTSSEKNSARFIVEKSRDLEQWAYVSEAEAAGNANYDIDYAVSDPYPFGGVSYYRLVQEDMNGERTIYGPVSVSCKHLENAINVFPNPSSGNFTAEILSKHGHGNATIALADLSGKIISRRSANLVEGVNQVMFDTESLAQGTYIVYVSSEADFQPVKLVIR